MRQFEKAFSYVERLEDGFALGRASLWKVPLQVAAVLEHPLPPLQAVAVGAFLQDRLDSGRPIPTPQLPSDEAARKERGHTYSSSHRPEPEPKKGLFGLPKFENPLKGIAEEIGVEWKD